MPGSSEESTFRLSLGAERYVRVINTGDDWEELIGVVDGHLDENLESVDDPVPNGRVLVFFPRKRSTQEKLGLFGVNEFTDFVLEVLRERDSRHHFEPQNLEVVDPDEIL